MRIQRMVAGGYESISDHPSPYFTHHSFPSWHRHRKNCALHLGESTYTLRTNWHFISVWLMWQSLKCEITGLPGHWSLLWWLQGCVTALHCHGCCLHWIRNGPPHHTWHPWQWNMGSFPSAYDSNHAGPCWMGEACYNEVQAGHLAQPNHHASYNWVSVFGIQELLPFSTPSRSRFRIHKLLPWRQPHLKVYPQS